MTVILMLSLSLLTKLITCYDVRSVHVIQDPGLSDIMFTDDVLFDANVRSPLECAQVCSATEECASFTYQRTSLTSCRGHTSTLTSNSSNQPAVGTKTYLIRRVLSGNWCLLFFIFTLAIVLVGTVLFLWSMLTSPIRSMSSANRRLYNYGRSTNGVVCVVIIECFLHDLL